MIIGHRDYLVFTFRSIYERLSFVKLPVKRMRSVFKKWLEFEEKFGTAETVAQVKLNAAKYVEQVERADLTGGDD